MIDLSAEQRGALTAIQAWIDRPDKQVFRLAGFAGTGKCLGFDTPVMRADGTIVPVQNIKQGDDLMGPDSKPRRVLATSVGRGPLFRIRPTKGQPWVCNSNHVMTLTGSKTRFYIGKTIDIALDDLLSKFPDDPSSVWKLFRVPVVFPTADLPLDPYFVGLWLGDGTRQAPMLTTAEPEVVSYCEALAAQLSMRCVVRWIADNNCWSVGIRNERRGSGPNVIHNILQSMLTSDREKHIRSDYLHADRAQRLALLAGLIDTDGYVSSGCIDFVTVSKPLFEDVLYLCRSLGLAAYGGPCRKGIKDRGFEGTYYRISISGDLDQVPCRVPRRQVPPRRQVKRVTVTGFTVEPIGDGDFYGFQIDGDGRFLLGDFTVTHNSTIAADAVKRAPGRVLYMAPTGRAALVMSQKGCTGAQTIHSGIYIPKGEKLSERVEQARREVKRLDERLTSPECSGAEAQAVRERVAQLRRMLRAARDEARPIFTLDEACELSSNEVWGVLVDEASMLGSRISRDLCSFGKPVLALGDPFQLPPVRDVDWFGSAPADAQLEEIHRQGRDSGILLLSMMVRRGEPVPLGRVGGDCEVLQRSRVRDDDKADLALAADQIIVGRNDTRRAVNHWLRRLRGFARQSPFPVPGDRVACLKNDYESSVLNGSCWTVGAAETDEAAMRTTMTLEATDGSGAVAGVTCHSHHFLGREEEIPHYQIAEATQFDFGYAVTCHKSQGGQYDSVLVIDESNRMHGGDDPRRHLYTAVTRAAKKLVVMR